MKKFYLLSTLLCSAMLANAQEVKQMELGEKVPVKVSGELPAFVVNPAMKYSNSVENMQRAPMADWMVFTLAPGVYSQMPTWTEDDGGYIACYPFDVLYGPTLVPWKWVVYFPTDAVVGDPVYTFVQRDLSGENPDVDLPNGLSTVWGPYNTVVRVTGVNGDGKTASWDRMDIIAPADSPYEADSYMWGPTGDLKVNFTAAFWGNIYGFYSGYTSGEYYGDGYDGTTGVASVFRAPLTPLYVYGGNALVQKAENASSVNYADITFEIWSLTEDGKLDEMLVQSTGGQMKGDPVGGLGSLEFSFQEWDETGLPVMKPVSIPAGKDFAVVLNNVEGSGLAVVLASDACGGIGAGGGCYLVGDEVRTFSGQGYSMDDPAIGLNGYIPGGKFLVDPSDIKLSTGCIDIPVGGGAGSTVDGEYNVVFDGVALFGSSHNYQNEFGEKIVNFTYPEWITDVQVDTTDYSKYGYFTVQFTGEALPEEMPGRTGEIVADIYGFKTSIQVGQGDYTIGVKDAEVAEVAARVEGEDIVLSYGEGVNRVDVVNVAGAVVASYELPANGFVVPGAKLADGLYILNFKGEKEATVKVVK